MKTFFAKIFGGYLLLTLVLSIAISSLIFSAISTNNYKSVTKNLKKQAQLLTKTIDFKKNIHKQVKDYAKILNLRITVINKNGNVISDSKHNYLKMDNHKNRYEFKQALQNKTCSYLRYSKTLNSKMLYLAVPIHKNNKLYGAIRLSIFYKDFNKLIGKINFEIAIIVLICMVIISIFSASLTKQIVKPIKQLVNASQKISQQNFDYKIKVKGKGEILKLANAFNNMSGKLKQSFMQINFVKNKLDTLIKCIDIGIATVKFDGTINIFNPAFSIFLRNTKNPIMYFNSINQPDVFEFIKVAINQKNNQSKQISVLNKVYLLNSLVYVNEIIITCYDITAISKLNDFKKDFVANASHELRTPLTAIYGFTQTMLEEDNITNSQSHYLKIIEKHSNRLIKIVNDLLVLSKIEDKSQSLQLKKINILEFIKNSSQIFKQKLKEKKLSINISGDNAYINLDPYLVEQVFVNLISNSIKYTDRGFINIDVSKNKNKVIVKIQDSGIGIPKNLYNRIFERFFVVDKARSRQTGGTGLGLSIVKHILLLHNASIDVASKINYGTTFTINFTNLHF